MDIISILQEYLISVGFIVVLVVLGVALYTIYKTKSGKSNRKRLLFEDFSIAKYSIILFRKIGESYHEIEKLKLDIKKGEGFKYHNKDFTKTFDTKNIAYTDNKSNYYAFDYDTGEQLSFKTKGMPDKVSIDDVDIYVNRGIIEQLVKGLEELKPKGQYIMLLIGIALGIALGIILGIYIAPYFNGSTPAITPTPTPPPF